MDAQFSIVADPSRDLVTMTLSGFFDLASVARFDAARGPAYAQMRCAKGHHLTLCDASGMQIQAQEIVAAFTGVVGDQRYFSRRLAIVVGSSLARLQTQRTTDRPNVAYFRDLPSAEAWLFADEADTQAA